MISVVKKMSSMDLRRIKSVHCFFFLKSDKIYYQNEKEVTNIVYFLTGQKKMQMKLFSNQKKKERKES